MSRKHAQDWYYGQEEYEKYHELVKENLSGKEISKRIDTADQPGGIEYEAKQLGIDLFDLLKCLEGMCRNGEAEELYPGDSYKVASKTANLPQEDIDLLSNNVYDALNDEFPELSGDELLEEIFTQADYALRSWEFGVEPKDEDVYAIYDVVVDKLKADGRLAKKAQAESAEYIAEQVVDFAKKNLNGWLDAGLDDVAIDDKLVDEINAYGVDDEKFGAVMDLVVGQLEAEGLLTDSRYVYAKGAASGYQHKVAQEDNKKICEEAAGDIVDACAEVKQAIQQIKLNAMTMNSYGGFKGWYNTNGVYGHADKIEHELDDIISWLDDYEYPSD